MNTFHFRLFAILFLSCFFPFFLFGQGKASQELIVNEYILPVTVDWTAREPLREITEYVREQKDMNHNRRESWKRYEDENVLGVDKYNEKLKPVNFSIVPAKGIYSYPAYDLMKGDSLYVAGLSSVFSFSIDKNNQFVIFAYIEKDSGQPDTETVIITNNYVEKWLLHFPNAYIYDGKTFLVKDSIVFYVVLDTENENKFSLVPIFTNTIKPIFEIFGILYNSFFVKDTSWIWEYEENVIVNGINIGEEKGYSKVFNYLYIKDKPFYFYEKDSMFYVSYDDKTLPYYTYKNIFHYQCCEPFILNPVSYNDIIWFFAQKEDDNWYYVEMGIYE